MTEADLLEIEEIEKQVCDLRGLGGGRYERAALMASVAPLIAEVRRLRFVLAKVLNEYADCGERLTAATFNEAEALLKS